MSICQEIRVAFGRRAAIAQRHHRNRRRERRYGETASDRMRLAISVQTTHVFSGGTLVKRYVRSRRKLDKDATTTLRWVLSGRPIQEAGEVQRHQKQTPTHEKRFKTRHVPQRADKL
jgi:hypothetical protein